MFSGGPKIAIERSQQQSQKMFLKNPIKTKIWCTVIKFSSLQILWATTAPSKTAFPVMKHRK